MRRINAWLILGIIGVCVFGSHFGVQYGRVMLGPKDRWWTPKSMALSLEQSRGELEVLVNDQLMQSRIRQGTLLVVDERNNSHPVVLEDVAVRLNNWDETKASLLHLAVFTALLLGMSLAALMIGAIQYFGNNRTGAARPDAGNA